MNLGDIKLAVGQAERTASENTLVVAAIAVAVLLAGLIFGGLALDGFITRKRARDKAKAVEKLRKHLDSLPSVKS